MAIPSNNVDMPLGVRRFAFHGDKNLCIVLGCKMAIYVATGLKVSLQKIEPFRGARVRYLHCQNKRTLAMLAFSPIGWQFEEAMTALLDLEI